MPLRFVKRKQLFIYLIICLFTYLFLYLFVCSSISLFYFLFALFILFVCLCLFVCFLIIIILLYKCENHGEILENKKGKILQISNEN